MKKQNNDRFFVRKNEQIRVPKILLVKDGQKIGVFNSADALRMARDAGLDLVEIAPNAKPPVCSILDFGKYKYDQQKKQKEAHKNTASKEKEISFRYVIEDHDLKTKVEQAKKFLDKGDRVKIIVKFKSRENAHKDQGMVAMKECLELLKDHAEIEKNPSFEGSQLICRVTPKEKK